MTMEAKIRPWLLWTLIGVVLIGGGFTYWYISGGKSGATTTTSPTPTKSAVVSPGTSPTATSGTTTGGTGSATGNAGGTGGTGDQTSTPANTSTPTNNPPAGWKYDSQTLKAHGTMITGRYTILIKNDWTSSYNSINQELREYAINSQGTCVLYGTQTGCAVIVQFNWGSTTTESNVYWTTDHKGYFTLTFPNNNLSEADRKTVTDNFSAGETGTI